MSVLFSYKIKKEEDMQKTDELLQVGAITTTHGVRGEVKVFPTTDDAKRFSKLKEVEMEKDNGTVTLHVQHVKYFKQMVIVKFKEYNSMNEVENLRGKKLYVTRENAVKLSKDEYFIADLIDINVIDEEKGLKGVITDVIQTGANDVYEITLEDGRSFLMPAIKDCVKKVDMDERVMLIHIMEGLLD